MLNPTVPEFTPAAKSVELKYNVPHSAVIKPHDKVSLMDFQVIYRPKVVWCYINVSCRNSEFSHETSPSIRAKKKDNVTYRPKR